MDADDMNLEEAKKVILDHIDKIITVKNTKLVYDEEKEEYKNVDAGYSEDEIQFMQSLRDRDMKHYCKLKDLLEEWI